MSAPRLAVLLPARNCEHDLDGWFRSVERFADVVVALDDGSTDGTLAALKREPLAEVVLSNPRRDSYEGWDDAANRNRLLEAAAEVEPDWILSLDADERIDESDARALREFLATDAIPACAYGLQHYRIWGEREYDPRFSWVFRLFPFEADQRFPEQRLHFDPVPTAITRAAWVRTSLRIQHLGAASPERIDERLAKYRQADPERRWATDYGDLSRPPRRDLPAWEPRPAHLAVLAPPQAAAPEKPPRLAVLLPARNCEHDLDGWFRSVERFADVVVALDDGSTDGTLAALKREPLAEVVLSNPRRDSYEGWDDAANRNRLLEAAAEVEPDWILSLDADERIDESDARALREFLNGGAERDAAYGFRVLRMIGSEDSYDQDALRVYRLFAYAPDQRFPDQALHFVPVPTSIDRRRFVDTRLRIKHLASVSEDRRRARFAKYREADPDNAYQRDYSNLLRRPGEVRRFEPLPEGDSVLESDGPLGGMPPLEAELADDAPALSAVVISRNDEDRIEHVVRAVVEQRCPEPFEVIVVTSGTDRTADIVRDKFPQARLVELTRPAFPGAARNAGVRVARGEFVSFPGSHVELPPGSLAARLRAHRDGHAMVTGTTLNGTPTRAGWANYFLDHSSVLPGRPSERLMGPPAHCSYIRDQLLALGGFPEDLRAGEDTVVNVALYRRGVRAYRARDVRLTHRSRCTTPRRLLKHHFQRGRGMGRILLDEGRGGRGLVWTAARNYGTRYLPRRLEAVARQVARWGDGLEDEYRRARPLVTAGAVAALAGIWFELLRPGRGKVRALFASPRRPRLRAGRGRARERFPAEVEVNAYVLPGAAGELAIGAGSLSWVAPFAHGFEADGTLVQAPGSELPEDAPGAPLMALGNVTEDGFDRQLASRVLHDDTARQRLLDNVVAALEAGGYAGLNVDFERVAAEDRELYNHFLGEAAERLRAAGLLLSTAVSAPRHGHDGGAWSAGHDQRFHGQVADFVVLMAYQWLAPGAAAGPTAALPDVRAAVRYALERIPAEKLMLGLPLYGHDWRLGEPAKVTRALTLAGARDLAERQGAEFEYDAEREAPFFRYRDDEGAEHEVWFEDRRSLHAKLDLVRAFGLRGLSLWRLPGGYPEVFELIDELFAVRAPDFADGNTELVLAG